MVRWTPEAPARLGLKEAAARSRAERAEPARARAKTSLRHNASNGSCCG